jgi:hypothetical protein
MKVGRGENGLGKEEEGHVEDAMNIVGKETPAGNLHGVTCSVLPVTARLDTKISGILFDW